MIPRKLHLFQLKHSTVHCRHAVLCFALLAATYKEPNSFSIIKTRRWLNSADVALVHASYFAVFLFQVKARVVESCIASKTKYLSYDNFKITLHRCNHTRVRETSFYKFL